MWPAIGFQLNIVVYRFGFFSARPAAHEGSNIIQVHDCKEHKQVHNYTMKQIFAGLTQLVKNGHSKLMRDLTGVMIGLLMTKVI